MKFDLGLRLNELNEYSLMNGYEDLVKEVSNYLSNNAYCTLKISATVNLHGNKWIKLGDLFQGVFEKANLDIDESLMLEAQDSSHTACFDALMAGYCFIGLKREINGLIRMKVSFRENGHTSN